MNAKKLLINSRLAKAYNELPDNQYRLKIEQEYINLLKSSLCKDKMLYKHLKKSILPAIAFYRVLQNSGYSKDKSIDIIRDSVFSVDEPRAKIIQSIGKMPFFFSLFRIMCRNSLKSVYGKSGWDMRWISDTPYEMTWDCHSCFYEKEFSRHGVQELTVVFCQSDDKIYGNVPNVRWERTKTIGLGAEICDFRFYNTKNKKS
jgi:hypothetical protein